jgi:hypothetical protein
MYYISSITSPFAGNWFFSLAGGNVTLTGTAVVDGP